MKIPKLLAGAVLLAALAGCGGGRFPKPNNLTTGDSFSDPRLQSLWEQAQQSIATQQFDLNAALIMEGRNANHAWRTPDERALKVSPKGITITAIPDIPLAQLRVEVPKIADTCKADPCGIIKAPEGASASYCRSWEQGESIYVAASLQYAAVLEWEFENYILWRLGYNVGGR